VIPINRGPKPDILVEKEQEWTEEYRRFLDGDSGVPDAARTRYRHTEIKDALIRDSHEKCIYCESAPRHVAPGDVEHLKPKSHFPDQIVEWENLGFVCPECNLAKSDFYDDSEPVIDPYTEDPANFLRFGGPMVFEQPGSARGIVTIRKLELDRLELFERRADHLRRLQDLLNVWTSIPSGPAKDEIAAEIRNAREDPQEYAAASRAFLAMSGF
jgi:uncharacterized protein (TIGR02646 family)